MTGPIVAFGTYRRDLHPRVGVLVDGLREQGHQVTELNEPLPVDTAARVRALKQPWLVVPMLLAVVRCWGRLALASRRLPERPSVVLVGYLGHFDVHLARLCFPRSRLVLDHLLFASDTARDRGSEGALLQRVLRAVDRAALRAPDLVLTDTTEHADMARRQTRRPVATVPVGATAPWYDVPPPAPHDGPLRLLFFGLFTPLQGAPVIAEAVRLLGAEHPVELTMVGRGQDMAQVHRLLDGDRRVRFVEWAHEPELLRLAAEADVVLGIFGTSDKALRVVPNKVYQGLAAGRLVITSDTRPQRDALDGSALLVPPGDPAALAAAVARVASDRSLVQELGARARAAAAAFTPASAAAVVLQALPVDRAARGGRAVRGGRAAGTGQAPLPPLAPLATLRWATVAPRVRALAPRAVLEIGAGQGAMGARLARLDGVDYLGVEPDETSYRTAAERVGDAGEVRNTTDEGVAAGSFDLVAAFEVLEHLGDDDAALRRWLALARPGGHLILSVPAWNRRMGPWDAMVGHYRRYSPTELRSRLEAAGWEPVEVRLYAPFIGRVMEVVRNRLAERRLDHAPTEATPEQLSTSSGRVLQPGAMVGRLVGLGMAPWVLAQRALPNGNAIVAVARRPAA